jgi:dihydropyrimidine dehydrogenase (NADP+)
MNAVMWEVRLMEDLGVKVVYGKSLGKDFTVESLRAEGYDVVFVGIGLPKPKVDSSSHSFFHLLFLS